MNTELLQRASALNINEQIELVKAIWDGIVARGQTPSITDAQALELDRRHDSYLANPNNVVPWSEVKAAALSQTRR